MKIALADEQIHWIALMPAMWRTTFGQKEFLEFSKKALNLEIASSESKQLCETHNVSFIIGDSADLINKGGVHIFN